MTYFEYINQNITRIKYEAKIGLISTFTINRWAIYCRFDFYRKTGERVTSAINYTAKDFKLTDTRELFKIKKQMEQQIPAKT